MIKINEKNKKIIENAIRGVDKFPIKMIKLYTDTMPFSRKTFHRGVIELQKEGKVTIETKSFGRGLGIFVMVTTSKL